MRIGEWVIEQLEPLGDAPRVLVRDPLRLLPESDGQIQAFALSHGFTVVVASTNLVFRELYDKARADPTLAKLMVIDRAPPRRKQAPSTDQAPAPFYPDLLAVTPADARVELDLYRLLARMTGDANWPRDLANDPRYARLIAPRLDAVARAHRNLRAAHHARFTDEDFQRIVAFAALGVPESAFKKLGAEDYWKIGLVGHDALGELSSLTPDVTATIKSELQKAPAPFRWLASNDPEPVIRAFYLAVVLAQHLDNWRQIVASIDPSLGRYSDIAPEVMAEAAPTLVALDPDQARSDLEMIERDLDREALRQLLDQLRINAPEGFAAVLERERYSTLLRCLALFAALDNLLGPRPDAAAQQRVASALETLPGGVASAFVAQRQSATWDNLVQLYTLGSRLRDLRAELAAAVRELRVTQDNQLTFDRFWDLWNTRRLNRIEHTVSALIRNLDTGELLPRSDTDLPPYFGKAVTGLRQRARLIYDDVYAQLDELNRHFQTLVAARYPTWLAGDTDVRLTSQFIRRSLKAHWDPQKEKAVVLVFDGMRYDIWDELLRPLLEDRMELLADAPASSLLPSETHISRWALAAGAPPAAFYPRHAENQHLKDALARDLDYTGPVHVLAPEGAGIGETVRYRAGNLDYYIFEFCDKELHKITMKELPGGRQEPARPLALIYQQLRSFLANEVMAIVRTLAPGTKVFITADHGFGPIRDQPLWFESQDLNEPDDCSYRTCRLRVPFDQAHLPPKARDNMIAFTPDELGVPRREAYTDRASGQTEHKDYRAVVFPKVGYAFSRHGSAFRPSAYSHGGISLQELLIPMVALRVRQRAEGLLTLGEITGPTRPAEGEEMEFRMRIGPTNLFPLGNDGLRVSVEASFSRDPDAPLLPSQVLYVSAQGAEVRYRFRADRSDATQEELARGEMERTLTITAAYPEGRRTTRKARIHTFTVQLNTERVARRVPPALGGILGLMPKGF